MFCGALCGCSKDQPEIFTNKIQTVSTYEYDYYCGHNAAVNQFGSECDNDLVIDLNNLRVVEYASFHDHHGYADGYHQALDIIDARKGSKCPDLH